MAARTGAASRPWRTPGPVKGHAGPRRATWPGSVHGSSSGWTAVIDLFAAGAGSSHRAVEPEKSLDWIHWRNPDRSQSIKLELHFAWSRCDFREVLR